MVFLPWYERFPEILAREVQAYKDEALGFNLDSQLLAKTGVVAFEGNIEAGGMTYATRVFYPSGFPYVRPEVVCPGADLARHQNPTFKNLCVIANDLSAWRDSLTGAFMVRQAMALLEAAHQGPDAVAAGEVDAPEPWSTWYPYSPGAHLLILDNPPETQPGDSGVFSFTLGIEQPQPGRSCALLTSVQHARGGQAWRLTGPPRNLAVEPEVSGIWFRMPNRPPFLAPSSSKRFPYHEYLDWAKKHIDHFAYRFEKLPGARAKAFGLVYPDEGPARNEFHDNWLVGIEPPGRGDPILFRPMFWTKDDHYRRMPALAGLAQKKVWIVGLGALGAALAISLAKAGIGRLGLIDHDFVDAGPMCRQEFDLRDLGLQKVHAMTRRLHWANPHTEIAIWDIQFGGTNPDPVTAGQTRDQLAYFAEIAQGSDMLISTTGSRSVDLILNEIGAALAIPRVFTWVLNGAWGGRVFRANPRDACYECLAYCYDEFPTPQEDPTDVPVFGRGCGYSTFTGTGFDAGAVANMTARLVVQTLLAGSPSTYPDTSANLLNWSSRAAVPGEFPKIEHFTVRRQERCRTCARYAS